MMVVLETGSDDGGVSLIEQARVGVDRAKADEVARLVGFTGNELARILHCSGRSLNRIRPKTLLDCNASERLLLLEALIFQGLKVFDGRAEVLGRWLRIPLPEFHRQSPLALMDTITEFGMVHAVLSRIEHGIYV